MSSTTIKMQSWREPVWTNISFFVVTMMVALIGTPLYIHRYGIAMPILVLFCFYMAATGLSITVGYHRLFSHRAFRAHPIVEFLVLFFGAAAYEQSALKWASQHRDHHQYVDTDRDPYNIKKGFFYAHMGWMMFWKHPENFGNSKDLQMNRMLMHQHRFYYLWAMVSGILLPVLIGVLGGFAGGAFIFAVCLRLTLVYQATFCINSVCHMMGKATYDPSSTAKDHWFVALLTYGEGYHNFHHRFPTDFRNAVRWYQWDPSKWLIYALSWVGLAWDLKTVSNFRILDARLAAENKNASTWILRSKAGAQLTETKQKLDGYYRELRHQLIVWEEAAKHHQAMLVREIHNRSKEMKQSALRNVETARKQFEISKRKWEEFQLKGLGLAL